MPAALNDTQLEILNLFNHEQTEEDLKEIKSLLVTILQIKLQEKQIRSFDEKGYTSVVFEKWKKRNIFVKGRDYEPCNRLQHNSHVPYFKVAAPLYLSSIGKRNFSSGNF